MTDEPKAVAAGHTLLVRQWNFLADGEARLHDSFSEFPEAGRLARSGLS
ncbi:hypothetical protein AB0K15_16855 [Amycolatopsis sp. NPDC049253]